MKKKSDMSLVLFQLFLGLKIQFPNGIWNTSFRVHAICKFYGSKELGYLQCGVSVSRSRGIFLMPTRCCWWSTNAAAISCTTNSTEIALNSLKCRWRRCIFKFQHTHTFNWHKGADNRRPNTIFICAFKSHYEYNIVHCHVMI